ncbi:hypothetical protein KIL84_008453 [Mauremys mutica]|uniref:Uncharacterized protein n=1 Tax=Mauremys mutica TaxID=74926 RepID=A0A9D4AXY5_9SAUR|nr:hypothetical protein KIL84_008453 [Mauremys mutica]
MVVPQIAEDTRAALHLSPPGRLPLGVFVPFELGQGLAPIPIGSMHVAQLPSPSRGSQGSQVQHRAWTAGGWGSGGMSWLMYGACEWAEKRENLPMLPPRYTGRIWDPYYRVNVKW